MAPKTMERKRAQTNKKKERKSMLAPFAPLFTLFNWVAFVGWSYILVQLVLLLPQDSQQQQDGLIEMELTVSALEAICLIEVLRIIVGDLPGNLVLGVVLHTIRLTVLTLVWEPQPWTGSAIYWSWAVTEVTRYPMYLFPNASALRSMRMVVPLVTFPLGAFSEAYATYVVLQRDGDDSELWKKCLFVAVLFVNGVLGPTMAYPALLKKGLPVLGLTKKKEGVKKND